MSSSLKIVTVVAIVLLTSCAGIVAPPSPYDMAAARYVSDAASYRAAVETIQTLRAQCSHQPTCKVSDLRYSKFRTYAADVKTADSNLWSLLDSWKKEGQKPSSYDSAAAVLKTAQDNVINLAGEVSR